MALIEADDEVWAYSERQERSLMAAAVVVGSASMLGCVAIVGSYLRFKQLRTFSFTLILMLSLADLGANAAYFLGNPETGTAACTAQALLQQFFQMSSILWTSGIAMTVYDTTVSQRSPSMLTLSLLCWLMPLVWAMLPLLTHSYGNTGAWCWIFAGRGLEDPAYFSGTFWRVALFYLPLWICVCFNAAIYIYVTRYVKTMSQASQSRETTLKLVKLIHRLRFYPLILVVAWFPATINRVHDASEPGKPIFWLTFVTVVCKSSQGLMNALTYGLNRTVREAWRQDLYQRYPLCRIGKKPPLPPQVPDAEPDDHVQLLPAADAGTSLRAPSPDAAKRSPTVRRHSPRRPPSHLRDSFESDSATQALL